MSKNSISKTINSTGTVVTETHSVNSRGRDITVTRTSFKRSAGANFVVGCNVLFLIACVILIVSLVRSLAGSSTVSFGGLLDYISSAPTINMSLTSFEVIPSLDWSGLLFPLACFLNMFINIFNVLVFAFRGLIQVVIYLSYFIRFVFL